MVLLRLSAFALALAGLVHVKGQAITPLSPDEIASFSAFTYFASTGYCAASTTLDWSCGSASLATFFIAACAGLMY